MTRCGSGTALPSHRLRRHAERPVQEASGVCYIEDGFGIKNRHEIGIDRICVEI